MSFSQVLVKGLKEFIGENMQIITGKYRARKLVAPETDETRPTLARVKESIFSILPLSHDGFVTLDLFAGSGAYGLESLSRGAKMTYFVDNSRLAIRCINVNAKNIKEDYLVLEKDCFEALKELDSRGVKFNLVFLDPPYKSDLGDKALAFIESHDMLAPGGIIVYEHLNDKKLLPKLLKRYIIIKSKDYSDKTVDFISTKN